MLLGPFGEPLAASGAVAAEMSFRFSTKYQDVETGLLYYDYRYYDPSTGRWLSRDPIGERGGINLYTYCQNLPSTLIDPFGLLCCGQAPNRSRYYKQSEYDTEKCKWDLCQKYGNYDKIPIDELRQKCGDAVADHTKEWRDKYDFWTKGGISYWGLTTGVGTAAGAAGDIAVNAANYVLTRPGLIAIVVGMGMNAGTRPGPNQAYNGAKQIGFFNSSNSKYPPSNIPLGY